MVAIAQPTPLDRPLAEPAGRPQLRLVPTGPAHHRHPASAVYRRRRLAALVLVLSLLAGLVAASRVVVGSLGSGTPQPAPEAPAAPLPAAAAPVAGEAYVVRPGDTLWSIASRLAPGGDVRDVVARLAERNGGPALHVGDVIQLQVE